MNRQTHKAEKQAEGTNISLGLKIVSLYLRVKIRQKFANSIRSVTPLSPIQVFFIWAKDILFSNPGFSSRCKQVRFLSILTLLQQAGVGLLASACTARERRAWTRQHAYDWAAGSPLKITCLLSSSPCSVTSFLHNPGQVIQGRISQEPQPTSSSLISQPEFQELIQLTKGQITTGTEVTINHQKTPLSLC